MIYLTVSSGVAMEIHYCMGKQAAVDFYNTADDKKCGRCGMKEKKGGCCSDEHKFYKLEDAHKNVSCNYDASISQVAMVNEFASFSVNLISSFDQDILHNNSPPVDYGPPIFIRNCVIRI
jgi:DNA polymerase II large subunit